MRQALWSAIAIGITACATPAAANEPCQPFVAVGATVATGAASFGGDAATNLGAATVSVAVNGLKPNRDGSINASTSHTFTIGQTSFTTRDNVRLSPLNAFGLYRLNAQGSLGDGAWGSARIDGMVDLANGWAKWLATGEVCR